MSNLRDQILAIKDLPTEVVETPEWAEYGVPSVTIRGLSAEERDKWDLSMTERTHDGRILPKIAARNVRSAFVAMIIVDETGNRVFSDKDARELGKKNALVIDRIYQKGRELSGITTPDVEDDAEDPSLGDQEDSSSSDSPMP